MLYVASIAVLLMLGSFWFADRTARGRVARHAHAGADVVLRRMAYAAAFAFTFGTFTWRIRTATDLANNAVDNAAAVRIGANVVAVTLVGIALAYEANTQGTRVSRPQGGWLPGLVYAMYIGVVALGAAEALNAPLVLFRVFDLGVMLLVAVAVARWCDFGACIQLVRGVLLLLAGLIGLSVLLFPSLAIDPTGIGVLPFRVQGVLPNVAKNGVGTIGVLLFALGLGKTPKRDRLAIAVGLLLVFAAAYRTGYVALVVVVAVYFIAVRGIRYRLLLVVSAPLVVVATQTAYVAALWQRGDSYDSTSDLSGRTTYWAVAFEVVKRSPWIGTGLTSGTRYEVLNQLGSDRTSTIHGTWIEAYLGTGRIGTMVLGAFFLGAVIYAFRVRGMSLTPLLLLTAITVRSITGSTFELASYLGMIVLIAALAASRCSALQTTPLADGVLPTERHRDARPGVHVDREAHR